MPSHRYTHDSARRACDLLLRVVAASPHPVTIRALATEWEVSWQTVRRLVRVAHEAAAANADAGRLVQSGRGEHTTLTWVPAAHSRGRAAHAVALAAALGPWRALGMDDVSVVLQQLLQGAVAETLGQRTAVLADILERGFYYQPWMPRQMRDPEALNEVLSALFYRSALSLDHYRSPSREHENVVLEPWTLVHALDGLYVLGPIAGEPEPRLWALHRMQGASRCRDSSVTVPRDYRPEALLGHGYGPFLSEPGRCTIRVPAAHVPYVLESPLPRQRGEAVTRPDGSVEIQLDVAPHPGLRMWARAVGGRVVASVK
ncbi:MAG: WYL domain-containing protein [Deltaproteobacteria bacterium]|nr:WYL domain-containing protein [Deltaproteobacteria bacterium]